MYIFKTERFIKQTFYISFIILQADVNVLVVDWRRGAMTLNYLQAAANTRLVGVLASLMIEKLNNTYNITPSMIHIIGHSLGAHIAGYIGERVSGIARITGKYIIIRGVIKKFVD